MNFNQYAAELKNIKPAKKVFVAFLDILGFSTFVEKNSHEDLIKYYQGIVRLTLDFSLTEVAEQSRSQSDWINNLSDESWCEDIAPKFDLLKIDSTLISDSIFLSTRDNSNSSFIHLIVTVRNMMARFILLGFPLRGAITFGEYTSDFSINPHGVNSAFLGFPIVAAVELEKLQEWSGCIIHESVVQELGINIINNFHPNFLVYYKVPIKKKIARNSIITNSNSHFSVVNWAAGITDDVKSKVEEKIRNAFSAYKKNSENVNHIIENTLQFFCDMNLYLKDPIKI